MHKALADGEAYVVSSTDDTTKYREYCQNDGCDDCAHLVVRCESTYDTADTYQRLLTSEPVSDE